MVLTSYPIQTLDRSALARDRALQAQASLANCMLCSHHCGVNRLQGEQGICHASSQARYFTAQTELSDELELIPTFAIALSGCDLRCDFCITGKESWAAHRGSAWNTEEIAALALQAVTKGAKSIMLLGGEPTIHLPASLALVAALPNSVKLVWKTNAHSSALSRTLLDGMFNVWLADYKFGNDTCALRLAKVPNYLGVVQENLLWTNSRCELIIHHLLMPGHVYCCWKPVARWIATTLPSTKVNLRTGFWPGWRTSRHPELRGTVSPTEASLAYAIAHECRLNLIE